jgi:hypothetical protein
MRFHVATRVTRLGKLRVELPARFRADFRQGFDGARTK